MQKNGLFCTLAAAALLAVGFQSCKKENGIDNNQVVKKPYSLYVVDNQGTLYNTNDGDDYKEIIFPADGYPSRAVLSVGNNLIWVKGFAHYSDNNGHNFNPITYKDNPNPIQLPADVFHHSMIYYVSDWNRVYLTAAGQGRANSMYSDEMGRPASFLPDTMFNKNTVDVNNAALKSFVRLNNGTLFALDYQNNKIFKKKNKDDQWEQVAVNNKFPDNAPFFLAKYNNTLLAGDLTGTTGVWYSTNEGVSWQQYTGLPARPVYSMQSPFGQSLLVGTDSFGVYRLKGTNFEPSNAGLGQNATVYSIVEKDDLFKNDVRKQYVFIASDKGIYRSEDLGLNWQLVKPGNYVDAY